MKIISVAILLINLFSVDVARAGEKEFCKKSVISISGSACWLFNIYSTPRIEKKGIDNTVLIDMKIPYFLFDESKHREFGPQSLVALNLSIKRNEYNESTQYESYFVIEGSNRFGDMGIRSFVEKFSNSKNYILSGETDLFFIYQANLPATSFNFFVPKNQSDRFLYLRCVKNCSIYSAYRNIMYTFHFPIAWKENYMDLQKLAESFLDSIIVNVEIKGAR